MNIEYCYRNCMNKNCSRNISHVEKPTWTFYGKFENCEMYERNVDGINVSKCEKHYIDNNIDMCYSDITDSHCKCNPKECQCCFYILSLEQMIESLKEDVSFYKNQCKYLEKYAYKSEVNNE